MLEARGRPDLGEEALGPHDGGESRLEDLDRDLPSVAKIVGQIDVGHPAFAELALDSVAPFQGFVQSRDGIEHGAMIAPINVPRPGCRTVGPVAPWPPMTHCRVPSFSGLGSAIRARCQRSVADRGRWAWAVGALAIGLPLPAEGQSYGNGQRARDGHAGPSPRRRPGIRPRVGHWGRDERSRAFSPPPGAGPGRSSSARSSWDTVMPHEWCGSRTWEPSRWTSLWCRLPSSSTRWWSPEPGGPRRNDNWGTPWRRWTPHSSPAPRSRAFPRLLQAREPSVMALTSDGATGSGGADPDPGEQQHRDVERAGGVRRRDPRRQRG